MEEWVKQILKDERQKRGEPLEVKRLDRIIISINLPLYGLRDRTGGRRFPNILGSSLKEV